MQKAKLPLGETNFELDGPENGPVVVLVHGFAGHMGIWNNNYRALVEAGNRVLRFDLFGRGHSERVKSVHKAELYVNQLAQLLDHLNISKKINLVGLSMGGAISVRFASAFDEKVEKLCLVASYGPVKADDILIRITRPPVIGEALMATLGGPILRRVPARAMHRHSNPKEFNRWFAEPLQQTRSKRSLLSAMRHFLRDDHTPHFDRVNNLAVPKLIVWGQHDRVLPFTYGLKVKALLPSAQWEVFENSGHLPHFEEADRFNLLVQDFITAPSISLK